MDHLGTIPKLTDVDLPTVTDGQARFGPRQVSTESGGPAARSGSVAKAEVYPFNWAI